MPEQSNSSQQGNSGDTADLRITLNPPPKKPGDLTHLVAVFPGAGAARAK